MHQYRLEISAAGVSGGLQLIEDSAKRLREAGLDVVLTEVSEAGAGGLSLTRGEQLMAKSTDDLLLQDSAHAIFREHHIFQVGDAVHEGREGLRARGMLESDIDDLADILDNYGIKLPNRRN